jgi:membrane fusion protein, multidrug efflux system
MEEKEINSSEEKKQVKIGPKIILGVVALVALIIITTKVWHAITHEETDNAQVEMRVVPILSRVSGYVDKIFVEDYASVKKGQLLMTIDTTELELQLEEMTADYKQSVADLDNAKASLVNAEAAISFSKDNTEVSALRKEKALNDFNRDKKLFSADGITQKQYDDSRSNYDITMKQLEVGRKDVRVAETRLEMLRSQLAKNAAQVDIKKARIDQQKLKISYCHVYATSDGKVGKRNADPGQFVQAGAPLFAVINSEELWIVANFKENQIKNIHDGNIVNISIDGYPKLEIKGKATSISDATGAKFALLPPDNATGNFIKVTQRIPVKIEIIDVDKYKNILRAGMSVEISAPIN